MLSPLPSLSTDQMEALVELDRHGSLRSAAVVLSVSEQGLRNRLISMEQRLGVQLYRKQRGIRRGRLITEAGRRLLPHMELVLEHVRRMRDGVTGSAMERSVHVATTQYLAYYLLADVVRRFHRAEPNIRVRLSVRIEQHIENELRRDPTLALAFTAPYEAAPDLSYTHIFSVPWSLVVPRRHRLAGRERVELRELATEPLIVFERGSTGRQHVLDAFTSSGLAPRIEMEATNTLLVVRMVESGLGVAIVPLLPDGSVTRGCKVKVCAIDTRIEPIRSGIQTRRGEVMPEEAVKLVRFFRADERVRKMMA